MNPKRPKTVDSKWSLLLNPQRLRDSRVKKPSNYDGRSVFENDYDRVVFSSAFRRLKNKAQVFSLDRHDFVRTRLTHSIEVSTIGRALGDGVAKGLGIQQDLGSLVATTSLLHDIGNPPFGHSGEWAIGSWFQDRIGKDKMFKMDDQEQRDLSAFEGNAQGFRIATRTQWSGTEYGLNLTSATLSALIKYPCSSVEGLKDGPKALKKFGCFKADQGAYELVRENTGLSGPVRHPLTFMMEAADDIAYATGDLEDVLKKGLVSYDEIRTTLRSNADEFAKELIKKYLDDVYRQLGGIIKDKKERQQIALQRFCQAAVRQMTKSAIEYFLEKTEEIIAGTFDGSIVEINGKKAGGMKLASLCTALKKVMEAGVYSHFEIITREQPTKRVIHSLLDAIDAELFDNPKGALAQKVYTLAPSNPCDRKDVSANYVRAMRMTDYVAGMTDTFAFADYQRINGMKASL